MAQHSSLRASDADREAVAERLRAAAVEGRLEPDELEERLDRAFRARTYGELGPLLRDLPSKPVRWERPRRGLAPTALIIVAKVLVALMIVAGFIAAAGLLLAWWMIGLVIWLAVSSRHGCRHRPPRVGRV